MLQLRACYNSPYVRVKRRTGSAGAGGAEARRNSSERRSSRLANSEPPYSMRHTSWPAALIYPSGRAMCRTTQPRCTIVLGGRAAASARASWCKPSLRWLAAAMRASVRAATGTGTETAVLDELPPSVGQHVPLHTTWRSPDLRAPRAHHGEVAHKAMNW